MKKGIYLLVAALMLAWCFLVTACHQAIDPSGTYVTVARSEFSIAEDTLVVRSAGDVYEVTRRTGYRLLKDGRLGSLRLKVKRRTATWDGGKSVLTVIVTGRVIRFDADSGKLIMGTSTYRRR